VPTRLRESRLRYGRRRRVYLVENYADLVGVDKDPVLQRDLVTIVRYIEAGLELPPRFYRRGLGVDRDALLERTGIMHLHLGGRNSNALLYLVQYEEYVAFLQISSHRHFETIPPGVNLERQYEPALKRRERRVNDDAASRASKISKALTKSGLRKKDGPPEGT
jgi:hypothetical protein